MKMTPQAILAAAALAGLLTGCSTAPKKECKGTSCKMCAGEKSNCGAKGNCTSKATCRAKGNCSAKKPN